jgi:hypothetical protein
MSHPHLVTSKDNPIFKSIKAQLREGGLRRTHTLLLGQKMIDAWEASKAESKERFRPLMWISRDGAEAATQARYLQLQHLALSDKVMAELCEMPSPVDVALLAELGPERGLWVSRGPARPGLRGSL